MGKLSIILSLSVFFLVSCKTKIDFEKTDSGLEYYFVEKNDTTAKPNIGDALVLNMKIIWNDSLIFDTREIGVDYRLHLKEFSKGEIYEGLSMMHIGDSAIFRVDAFNFYQITAKIPAPSCLKKDDKLTFYVRLLKIMSPEDIKREIERKNRMKLKNEQALLQEYLQTNNIEQSPLESGLYYIKIEKGYGPKPEIGDSVTVHYKGKLTNNQPFDSSFKRGEPYTFLYGDTTLIQGWTEGIGLMNEGGVAQLIIPSTLAYGKEGAGYVIPPYSTLVFEIHLLEVKKN